MGTRDSSWALSVPEAKLCIINATSASRPSMQTQLPRSHTSSIQTEGSQPYSFFLFPHNIANIIINIISLPVPAWSCPVHQIHLHVQGASPYMRTSSSPLALRHLSNAPQLYSTPPENPKMETLLPMLRRSSMPVANYCCPLLLFLS